MRRPIGLASAWLGAAVLVTANAASGLDLSYIPVPTEVVMKSLDTNLLVN
jgi:hypothetical protein